MLFAANRPMARFFFFWITKIECVKKHPKEIKKEVARWRSLHRFPWVAGWWWARATVWDTFGSSDLPRLAAKDGNGWALNSTSPTSVPFLAFAGWGHVWMCVCILCLPILSAVVVAVVGILAGVFFFFFCCFCDLGPSVPRVRVSMTGASTERRTFTPPTTTVSL